jgi:hypothetical protein
MDFRVCLEATSCLRFRREKRLPKPMFVASSTRFRAPRLCRNDAGPKLGRPSVVTHEWGSLDGLAELVEGLDLDTAIIWLPGPGLARLSSAGKP